MRKVRASDFERKKGGSSTAATKLVRAFSARVSSTSRGDGVECWNTGEALIESFSKVAKRRMLWLSVAVIVIVFFCLWQMWKL
jgi:hypothetical protein